MGQFGPNICYCKWRINLYTWTVPLDNKEVINNDVNCVREEKRNDGKRAERQRDATPCRCGYALIELALFSHPGTKRSLIAWFQSAPRFA